MKIKLYYAILHWSSLDSLGPLLSIVRRAKPICGAVRENITLILSDICLRLVWANRGDTEPHRLFWAIGPLNLCVLKWRVVFLDRWGVKPLGVTVRKWGWFWLHAWDHVKVDRTLLKVVLNWVKVELTQVIFKTALLDYFDFFRAKIHFALLK